MASARSAGTQRPAPPALAGLTRLEVLRRLEAGPRGLVEAEAQRRLDRYGENTVLPRLPAGRLARLLRALRDPFTAVLLVLGAVSAAAGASGTASVIAVLVAVSAVLRTAGEYRADRSAAALRELVAGTATVQRRAAEEAAPRLREVPFDQLVPGDVLHLGPGDLVPADVRLLASQGLAVYQAALTGESAPVAKGASDALGGTDRAGLPDRPYLCFAGSSVAFGTATAVVVATGPDTQFAGANRALAERRSGAFDQAVGALSWTLIRFMLLTAPLVVAADAVLRGRGLETLPFAVAVAVGLTPEMLPVMVTTALSRGAAELARRGGVIVKRLPALHDLGAVDVLCTDKTGTLTREALTVDCHLAPDGRPDPRVLRWAAVNSLWMAELADPPAVDALDEAVLAAARRGGTPVGDGLAGIAVLPFDPVRRLATAVVAGRGRPGRHILVVKGAVPEVVERCVLDGAERSRVLALAARKAAEGLRLLAVATAERPARGRRYTPADERGLTLLGIIGLRDELVPTAAEALAGLARRGVAVKVLTGDHPGTAVRACRELGLEPGTAVTGEVIDGLDDGRLTELAASATVFARCTPAHKARLVRALRRAGRTVGVLGDGVNDVPALHAADVGICPSRAADATREAADVVLAAKDLTAIDGAIAAGRRSTAGMVDYLRVAVSSNLGNVVSMLAAGVLLPFLPMLPAQVLVQNLCFDAAQLAFAFDRRDPQGYRRPFGLRPHAFTRHVAVFGLLNAVADLVTFAAMALVDRAALTAAGQAAFHSGWFTENLATQALGMLLLRRARSTATRDRVPRLLRWAAALLAAAGIVLPLLPHAALLGLQPMPLGYYGLLALVLASYTAALTAVRRVGRDRGRRP